MRRPRSQSWVDYFWSRVDQSGGPDSCWPFKGAINADGYGVIRLPKKKDEKQGRLAYTHRVAIVLSGRRLLDDQEGRHSAHCYTRSCSNPDHLQPGSHAENMADKQLELNLKKKGKRFGGAAYPLGPEDIGHGKRNGSGPDRDQQAGSAGGHAGHDGARRNGDGTNAASIEQCAGDQQAGGAAGGASGG